MKFKLDKSDLEYILKFIGYSAIFGILLNYSMFVIFNVKFTFYSWLGWGIGLWFLENKLVLWIRNIIMR